MPDVTITVCGTVTRDPELRYTSGGRGVASFGVAVNDRKFNKDTNRWEDGDASFFDVTAWGDLGEHVAECVTKGTRVVCTGRMNQRFWENAEGEKRSAWTLTADDIGPSLKWATATVRKAVREQAGEQRKPAAAKDDVYGDEEPFLHVGDRDFTFRDIHLEL